MPKKAQAAKKAGARRKPASGSVRLGREAGKPLNPNAQPVTKSVNITLARAQEAVRAYLARSH